MVEVGQVLVEHCEGPSARLFSTALEVEDVGADSLVRRVLTSVGSRPILLPKSAPVPTSRTTTTSALRRIRRGPLPPRPSTIVGGHCRPSRVSGHWSVDRELPGLRLCAGSSRSSHFFNRGRTESHSCLYPPWVACLSPRQVPLLVTRFATPCLDTPRSGAMVGHRECRASTGP